MATPTIETRPFTNEHVTIRSANPFTETKARLESLVPRIDDGIFTLLRYGEAERALRELEASPNLSIFSFRDHGALLAIVGQKRRSIQYDIGNPLTASKMTRHQLSAGIYAPIRVLLREDGEGSVLEYDRPAAVFRQFGDPRVDAVAQRLDQELQAVLQTAAASGSENARPQAEGRAS